MPRKPRKSKIMKRQITPAEFLYLTDAETPLDGVDRYSLWCYQHGKRGFDCTPHPRDLWEEHREEFLPAFIAKNPGRRPLAWWQWDAPHHDTGTGAYFEPLPEPRRMIGGTGRTTQEKFPSVVPSYDRGIPSSWAEIDPDDPPTFESSAAFLDRFGLLTPAEKKALAKMPEAWEPEAVKIE